MSSQGLEAFKGAEDASVDVLEFSRSREVELAAKDDPDATENSSSFADTTSGNGNISELSDPEVESEFFSENHVVPFDDLSTMFPTRKKKLTTHWRNFIHPLMWRCKWAELRIKELESQASKYSKVISAHDRRKHMVLNKLLFEQAGSRSIPFAHQRHRKISLKKRRKRVEGTGDTASYMSNHNLFSERESKRSDMDGVPSLDDLDNQDQNAVSKDEFGIIDDCMFPEDSDNLLELFLCKIESVHTRVHKLKARLDSYVISNASNFSSSENLSQLMACEAQNSPVRSPTFSACNGDTTFGLHSPNLLDYDLRDFLMPDGAVSSYGEVMHIPDIIESTVGLLSSIDVSQFEAQVGDSSELIVDNILLHNNEATEVVGSTLKNINYQFDQKTQDAGNEGDEDVNNSGHLALELDIVTKPVVPQDYTTLKQCLALELQIPKTKGKRGERKASSGNWSRQLHGEPDV